LRGPQSQERLGFREDCLPFCSQLMSCHFKISSQLCWNDVTIVLVIASKNIQLMFRAPFPRAAVSRLCNPLMSLVAVWKQLRLNLWFTKRHHNPSEKEPQCSKE
jgi:hypothetical protein